MSGPLREARASGPLRGELRVPGDKSVSHRSLLLNALATGPARVRGLLESGDVRATAQAVRALGASVEYDADGVTVTPPPRLEEPLDVIDCGNSGTSIRLLSGVLAALPAHSILTGDASLRRRPMGRVVEPLRAMGARIDGRDGGSRAPLAIRGGGLVPAAHDLPIASAQVKSALLLAGLGVGVRVREPARSRDHTERMLVGMGARLAVDEDGWIDLRPTEALAPLDVQVPGDLSSAAFFLVAGALVPGSEIRLRGVGVNPTRSGVLDVLKAMGADITLEPVSAEGAEPIADLIVRHGPLVGATIAGDLALRALDELPVLAIAASRAEGETVIRDAAELRVKESDRIGRVVEGLRAMGIRAEELPDGMIIEGGRPDRHAVVDAAGDHRLAMAFTVAGMAGGPGVDLLHAEEVRSSYPGFFADMESLRA